MAATRREFLTASLAGSTRLLLPFTSRGEREAIQATGRFLGTRPLGGRAGRAVPLGTMLGAGLDARLVGDLSTLTSETLVTPNERFFVRTASPKALPSIDRWEIQIGGLSRAPQTIPLGTLDDLVRPAGTHLLECSGNSDPSNYGLMSVARWDGIPLSGLLERVRPSSNHTHVLVAGVDDPDTTSRTSTPGASWIFSRDDLDRAGAFLATAMNGVALPRDHGLPVRLVVPGWYGCACIKWVNRIEFVSGDAAATSQMREFAARTHQQGVPVLARDFTPATIDHAALPVRVEKWLVNGRLIYRVIGILWGGARPTNALMIRFRYNQSFIPVDDCPLPPSTTTWSLWSHEWRPDSPGRYQIVLRVNDPSLTTRRLDLYFYTREVDVDEV